MIRIATDSDVPAVEQLMRSEPGFWDERWPKDALKKAIRAADGLAFVSEEGGEILGFVCAHDLGFRGYLSELIVRQDARSRNIGSVLLESIEQELRARGCPVVIADAWKTAEPFYFRLGWKRPDVVLLSKRFAKEIAGR